jgi:hypothetical protein
LSPCITLTASELQLQVLKKNEKETNRQCELLKAFKFFYVHPVLVTVSVDILGKFDCLLYSTRPDTSYKGSKIGSQRACPVNSFGLNDQVNRHGVSSQENGPFARTFTIL